MELNGGGCIGQVVGVVGDARDIRLDVVSEPGIYRPRQQEHGEVSRVSICHSKADTRCAVR